MKKRMAILMSMAITVNMIASVPVCATENFTDTPAVSSAISEESADSAFGDGNNTPEFEDEQVNAEVAREGENSGKEAPEASAVYDWGDIYIYFDSNYVENISTISVNDSIWKKVSYTWEFSNETYILRTNDRHIQFASTQVFNIGDIITITSTGYKDLTLKVTGTGKQWAVEKVTSGETQEQQDPPVFTGKYEESFSGSYTAIATEDENYISNITEIDVDEKKWDSAGALMALFGRNVYYPDSTDKKIVFDSSVLYIGNVITIKSSGYKDLYLKVTAEGNDFTVVSTDSGKSAINGASNGVNTLHVRLSGYFESAVTGQQKYDAVSGASTSVSSNKNSNVTVEVADLPDGQTPIEEDWKELDTTNIKIDTKKTTVNIDAASGMEGVYSTYDSSLTLSGIPQTIGTYPVSVTLTDKSGRIVTSNELTFKVFSTDEKLADHLKLENAVQTADGKYMYDMDPWVIPYFNGSDEVVTVPKEIKAWYGSHTSGTYGELGYAVSDSIPVQTLIIPTGCNLTMVNMKVLSSVKIVVQNGATLNVRDSSIHGQIEVQNGGSVSVNYDDYNNEFLTGASINGQLILDDGAILKNSLIYSNTNFLANGSEARHNTSPVVMANGNVKVEGKVYIRGDEAATGTDSSTGKSYSGQPALKVSNGTLLVGENSLLAVYGGGNTATTSVGGAAVILDNASISGKGNLIAVAGRGDGDDGGNAVEGTGKIETAGAYLEGGTTYVFSNKEVTSGKAFTDTITISSATKSKAVDGKIIKTNSESAPETYWSGTTEPDQEMISGLISLISQSMSGDEKIALAKEALSEAFQKITADNSVKEADIKNSLTEALNALKAEYPEMENINADIKVRITLATTSQEGQIEAEADFKDGEIASGTWSDQKTISKLPEPTAAPKPTTAPEPTAAPVPTATPTATPAPITVPDTYPDGTTADKDGNYVTPEGTVIEPDGTVILPDGTKLTPDADGKKPTVNKDETVTDTIGNVYATDGSIKDSQGSYTKPAKVVLEEVNSSKNSVKIKVSENCSGAQGYDIVIGNSEDMLSTRQYAKILRNQTSLESAFANMDEGNWYVACHAWIKDASGKKVFGQWSEVKNVEVTAVTPQTPEILKVTVKGSVVTIKYTKSKDAQGYDIVLSKKYTKTNGQKRPAVSEKNSYVKKIKGSTVIATFRNVEPGTYYAGLHAWNRTSDDNTKVFSNWSYMKTVKVK